MKYEEIFFLIDSVPLTGWTPEPMVFLQKRPSSLFPLFEQN